MKQFKINVKIYGFILPILLIIVLVTTVEIDCMAQVLTPQLKNQYIALQSEFNILSSKLNELGIDSWYEPVRLDNNVYKPLKLAEPDINLLDNARVVNGYEAINLSQLDPISLNSFLELLQEGPLHLVVATVQDNRGNQFRQYFTLDAIEELIKERQAEVSYDNFQFEVEIQNRDEQGRLLSPLDRQPITNVEYFVIQNLNALPEKNPLDIPLNIYGDDR